MPTRKPPGPTYGYRRVYDSRGDYVTQLPAEPQASVAREIISRVAQGQPVARIRRELESREVPAPRGGARWSSSVIQDIARNPAYVGRDGDQDEIDWSGKPRWTPLVPDDLFLTAQRALAGPNGSPSRHHALGLLPYALLCCRDGLDGCIKVIHDLVVTR